MIQFDAMDGAIAEKALMLARLNRAELEFLHLIEPDGMLDGGYPGSSRQAGIDDLKRAALRRLEFLAASLGAGEARCHAEYGSPRQEFHEYAREHQPDLIVTGEQAAYLAGSCDVLVLSAAKQSRHGGLPAAIARFFGLRSRTRVLPR